MEETTRFLDRHDASDGLTSLRNHERLPRLRYLVEERQAPCLELSGRNDPVRRFNHGHAIIAIYWRRSSAQFRRTKMCSLWTLLPKAAYRWFEGE